MQRMQAGAEVFVVHVLDPALLKVKLVDQAHKLLGEKWPGTKDPKLTGLTFQFVDKKPICFFNGHR